MKRIVILLLLLLPVSLVFSQDLALKFEAGKTYRIEFADGSTHMGIFLSEDNEWIEIDDIVVGPVKYRKKAITEYKEMVFEEKGMFPNPHYSRQLFGPTAIPQGKGDFYWNNLWLEANTLQYGLTKNLSIGLGTGLFSTLAGFPVILSNLKYGHSFHEKHHLALGHFHIWSWLSDESTPDQLSLSYLAYTIGNKEKNFTIGMGASGHTKTTYTYVNNHSVYSKKFEFSKYPVVYGAFTTRTGRNWLFQGESYFITYNDTHYDDNDIAYKETTELVPVIILSARYIKPNHSWDFAVGYTRVEGDSVPFPLFGYTQKF